MKSEKMLHVKGLIHQMCLIIFIIFKTKSVYCFKCYDYTINVVKLEINKTKLMSQSSRNDMLDFFFFFLLNESVETMGWVN